VVFIFLASLQSLAIYGFSVAAGLTSLAGVQAVHLELVALMTIAAVLSQQFFVRVLHDLPDRMRRALLGLYLLLAAAWLVREALVR
jgi:uncharacterized membrane protein YfcA